MSTYYALVCLKHRECVNTASWGLGGITGMGSDDALRIFLIAHAGCELRSVSEHDQDYDDDYTEWENENADDLHDAAIERRAAEGPV